MRGKPCGKTDKMSTTHQQEREAEMGLQSAEPVLKRKLVECLEEGEELEASKKACRNNNHHVVSNHHQEPLHDYNKDHDSLNGKTNGFHKSFNGLRSYLMQQQHQQPPPPSPQPPPLPLPPPPPPPPRQNGISNGNESSDSDEEESDSEDEEDLDEEDEEDDEKMRTTSSQSWNNTNSSSASFGSYGLDYPSYPAMSGSRQNRFEEGGKSYLELGAYSVGEVPYRKTTQKSGYVQQRMLVLHISMCKLNRFRQLPDTSLHRSVLICNTVKYIEREMEREGMKPPNGPSPSFHSAQQLTSSLTLDPPPSSSSSLTSAATAAIIQEPSASLPISVSSSGDREVHNHQVGSQTDFSNLKTTIETEKSPNTINWGSVLSLSSQADMDPLQHNSGYQEFHGHYLTGTNGTGEIELNMNGCDLTEWKLTPLSAEDVLKSVPSNGEQVLSRETKSPDFFGEDFEHLMRVLVGT